MTGIRLSRDSKDRAARDLQAYLKAELDMEISGFDLEFLLEFIAAKLGPHFYNQGLIDAQAALRGKLELLFEAADELQQPIPS